MAYTPKRPGTVIFVAVVLIILGCWSLLGGVCAGGFTAVMALQPEPAGGKANPMDMMAMQGQGQRFMAKEVPGYTPTLFVILFFEMLFGVGQLIAGIGLLRLSSAARMLTLVLVAVKLVYAVAYHAYNLIFILPATGKMQQQMMADLQKMGGPNNPGPPPEFGDAMAGFTQAAGFLGVGCTFAVQLTIAIMIFIILNMQTTKAAFAAAASGVPPEDDGEAKRRSRLEGYDDEEDDYKRPGKPPKSPGDTGFKGTPD